MKNAVREYKFKSGATVQVGRVLADIRGIYQDANYVITDGFEVWFRGELVCSTTSWEKAAAVARGVK